MSVYLAAAPGYSDWSPPINLGPGVNSAAEDFAPHISKNGLSLYFASTRPGGLGGEDLWVSKRASIDAPWGEPVNSGPSSIRKQMNDPPGCRGMATMFFATTRAGGSGGFDIWVSWRHDTRDDFGWQTPLNWELSSIRLRPTLARYFENDDAGVPLLFLASNRPGGAGGLDIYVSELTASGLFGPPVLVNELSGAVNDLTPASDTMGSRSSSRPIGRAQLARKTCGFPHEMPSATPGWRR